MEAIATRVEAIALRLEAMAMRLEATQKLVGETFSEATLSQMIPCTLRIQPWKTSFLYNPVVLGSMSIWRRVRLEPPATLAATPSTLECSRADPGPQAIH